MTQKSQKAKHRRNKPAKFRQYGHPRPRKLGRLRPHRQPETLEEIAATIGGTPLLWRLQQPPARL